MANRDDYRQIARTVPCPMVVIAGRQDGITPAHAPSLTAQSIPHASTVIIEDCVHMVTFERPSETSDARRSWLVRDSTAIAA